MRRVIYYPLLNVGLRFSMTYRYQLNYVVPHESEVIPPPLTKSEDMEIISKNIIGYINNFYMSS